MAAGKPPELVQVPAAPEEVPAPREPVPAAGPDLVQEIEALVQGQDGTSNRLGPAGTGWRIEVTRRGAKWQWRSGSRTTRKSAPGGSFEDLEPERQQEYYENRKAHHDRKANHAGRNQQVDPVDVDADLAPIRE